MASERVGINSGEVRCFDCQKSEIKTNLIQNIHKNFNNFFNQNKDDIMRKILLSLLVFVIVCCSLNVVLCRDPWGNVTQIGGIGGICNPFSVSGNDEMFCGRFNGGKILFNFIHSFCFYV